MRKTNIFFYSQWVQLAYIQAFARSCSFWKSAENLSFWTFFNSSVTASWISATSAKWSPFEFIFNLGNRKYSGGDKSGDYGGVIKGCNFFWGQKLANTCSFVSGRIIGQQEKISRTERFWTHPLNALQEAIHYAFINFCIYYFSLWYEFFVHYTMRVENNYQHFLDAGPWNFSFFGRGDVSPTHSELCRFFSGSQAKHQVLSPVIILVKNFVCIGHGDNVLARCDSIFPLLRCQGVWNKTCTQLSLYQIFFQNPMGMFEDSAIILVAIRRSFLTKSTTAAMFTSVRVDFGRPPLS